MRLWEVHFTRTSRIDASTPREKGASTFLPGQVCRKRRFLFRNKAAYFPRASALGLYS